MQRFQHFKQILYSEIESSIKQYNPSEFETVLPSILREGKNSIQINYRKL